MTFDNSDTSQTPAIDSYRLGASRKRSQIRKSAKRRKLKRRAFIGLIIFLVLILVMVGSAFGYYEYITSKIKHITVQGMHGTTNVAQPENILLVGNNSRCALNGQQASQFGSCSQVGGARSDVLMVVHLNPANHTAYLLSIPRDLFVPLYNFAGTAAGRLDHAKVDAALNNGPSQLVAAVEEDFGIPISHYVSLNFDTFQGVVNDLGGINMYFPTEVKDYYSNLSVNQTGCLHLNGTQALALVRARHMYYMQNGQWLYDGNGDISRITRNHLFLKALAAEVRPQLTNPFTDNALLNSLLPNLQVDQNFSVSDMVSLVLAFKDVSLGSIPTETLATVAEGSFDYKNANFGSVLFPVQPAESQVISQFLGYTPGQNIVPNSFSLQVLNGTGAYNVATNVASSLTADGFNITSAGNQVIPSTSYGSTALESTVYYKPGFEAQAEKLMSNLSGTVIMGQEDQGYTVDVTLVVGNQLQVAPPSSNTTTAPSSGSQTNPSNSSISSPTVAPRTTTTSPYGPVNPSQVYQSNRPVPWFDPVACTPGQPVQTLTG